jgi:mRNA interferase MazF
LLSRNRVYQVRASATVATLTTTIRGLGSEVRLGTADGVPRDCVVNLDTIHTIAIGAIQSQIAMLSPQKIDAVNRAIRFALDLD